jgi:hypothetical protein
MAFILSVFFITGCSLTTDLTPPPASATSRATPSIIQSTASPQPTPTATEETVERETSEDPFTQGSIRGAIDNGSEGGLLPDALEVTLYGFDDQREAFSKTTMLDENGEYQFANVEVQPGRVYVATVEYQGAIYTSEAASFTDDDEMVLPITIYESTTDLTNVRLDRVHLIFDIPVEGVLQVTELWIVSNLGDRTIASETGEGILEVAIPDEAVNLNFESGMVDTRFEVTAEGFIDHFPIRPGVGSQEVVFSFIMPIDQSSEFSQRIAYPVDAVVVLTPEGIAVVKGEGVQDLGFRQMASMTLHNYSMGSITPDGILEFTLERESGAGLASGGSNSVIEVVVGAVIFAAALGSTGFWFYRRRKEEEVERQGFGWSEVPIADLEALDDQDEILQALADLDDAYEIEEIKYAPYQKRRNALKRRLIQIMKQARND